VAETLNSFEKMLREGPVPVNVGVLEFAESLEQQGIHVVRVEWTPPAGGDEQMAALLEDLL